MPRSSFDDRYAWALEKEPTYTGRPRPVIPLSYGGAVKAYFARQTPITRCSVCERMTSGAETCAVCIETGARRVECECGYLREGEQCGCEVAA